MFVLSRSRNGIGNRLANRLGVQHYSRDEFVNRLKELPNTGELGINYGVSSFHFSDKDMIRDYKWINNPFYIHRSVNKLTCFSYLVKNGIPVITHSTSVDEADKWQEQGYTVYCRTLISSSKGKGIKIVKPNEIMEEARLYTRSPKNKIREFRVHSYKGSVIDITEKRRKGKKKLEAMGLSSVNEDIRNLSGGWVFCKKDKDGNSFMDMNNNLVNILRYIGTRSQTILGLDYGASDILVFQDNNENLNIQVLEFNSAPSMVGSTLDTYVELFNGEK